MQKKRRKAQTGDVFEVITPSGLAYFQYTHPFPDYHSLIRVLPGTYPSRPEEFATLVLGPDILKTFYPVDEALKYDDLINLVGSYPIPKHAQEMPVMRARGLMRDDKTFEWWIYESDGVTNTRVSGQLSAEQEKLPIRTGINHEMLVELIVGKSKLE